MTMEMMAYPGMLVTESILLLADAPCPAVGDLSFFGSGRFGVVIEVQGRLPIVVSSGCVWVYCPAAKHNVNIYCCRKTPKRLLLRRSRDAVLVGRAVGDAGKSGLVRMEVLSPPPDPELLAITDRMR